MSLQNTIDAVENSASNTTQELFALTDEQILGIVSEDGTPAEEQAAPDTPSELRLPDKNSEVHEAGAASQTGVPAPLQPPKWLADKMEDPRLGDEARDLWASMQKAQSEAAAYREVFANPEDGRALKELYPGGVAAAKSAAERAQQLADIDGAYFGAAGKSAQELSAGRTALAQRLFAQDAAAFREMVAEGVRLLETMGAGTSDKNKSIAVPATNVNLSPAPANTPPEAVNAYRTFEKAANADLEKTVGAEITRRIDQALPNLRQMRAPGSSEVQSALPLQERLGAAVREEIDAALKSDAQLGEQVARVLAGRRFDDAARSQVVRLIDARAQQLVPGAVRKVVGQWDPGHVELTREAFFFRRYQPHRYWRLK